MDEVDDDERAIELSSIAAIYPELVYSTSSPYAAILDLTITPIKPLKIRFSDPLAISSLPTPSTSFEASDQNSQTTLVVNGARDKNGRNDVTDEHSVEHLPPLRLSIELPVRYPAEDPPEVTLSVSPQWLSEKKLRDLESSCTRLWEEFGRDQTVYGFIDHLQQEAETAFGLSRDDSVVAFPADLQISLLDFNSKTKREKFENETFDCAMCLEPKKGKDCHRLMTCGHVFCVGCLQDFYNNCITEGDVDSVKCIDPSCGKNNTPGQVSKRRKLHTLNPSELLTIPIEQELVQRYARLKRKKRLESDKNVAYCPRQWCQGPARNKKHPKSDNPFGDFESDSESEDDTAKQPPTSKKKDLTASIPMSQRLCVCEDCDFAFCCVCEKSWHGELGNCVPRRKRKELDEEEKATLAYLRHYSTPCPTCEAPSQKSHGCNHMICFKCNTHFCYLCSAWLMPENPYQHFNTQGTDCYMRLWELEQGDGEGVVQRPFENWGELTDDEEEDFPEEEAPALGPGADMADIIQAVRQIEAIAAEPAVAAAPPRPRENAIEFVNFAAQAGQQGGRRIIIPNQVEEPPPPPAEPQAVNARRRNQYRGRNPRPPQDRAPQPANGRRAAQQRRPQQQQGNNRGNAPQRVVAPAAAAAPNPPPALQRFLQLAQRDAEDEWDSDELDEFFADEDGDGDEDSSDETEDEVNDNIERRRRAALRAGRFR